MISLFLFFIISIFNGDENIDWDLRFYSDQETLEYHCYTEKIWGCSQPRTKEIHLLLSEMDTLVKCPKGRCSVISHEIVHATYFEQCAKYIGKTMIAPITFQYCYNISNWHK